MQAEEERASVPASLDSEKISAASKSGHLLRPNLARRPILARFVAILN
jgi:hypothetical protein